MKEKLTEIYFYPDAWNTPDNVAGLTKNYQQAVFRMGILAASGRLEEQDA